MTAARCMIYRCNHNWQWIPNEHRYVGHQCTRCGDTWDIDWCHHDPGIHGCECAR